MLDWAEINSAPGVYDFQASTPSSKQASNETSTSSTPLEERLIGRRLNRALRLPTGRDSAPSRDLAELGQLRDRHCRPCRHAHYLLGTLERAAGFGILLWRYENAGHDGTARLPIIKSVNPAAQVITPSAAAGKPARVAQHLSRPGWRELCRHHVLPRLLQQ